MYNSFPVCRTILDHWIYKDCEYLKVWITMLSRARYLKDIKVGIHESILYEIHYGEFIFGYKKWSENTGISYQRLRGLVKKMISCNMIILKKQTSKFSIYEIINYEKYNSHLSIEDEQFQDADNIQVTTRQHSENNHITTNKEEVRMDKKDKNDGYENREIFTCWNIEKIVEHKKLTQRMNAAVSEALVDYTKDEILGAIKNYSKVLRGDKYYFSHKWTLEEFLKRGLERFLKWDICRDNFQQKGNNFSSGNVTARSNVGAYDKI